MAESESTDVLSESSSSNPSTSSDTGLERECSTSSTTSSLLSRLKPANPSELSRKHKIDRNPPPKGKRRSQGRVAAGPKSVSPSQRVNEHPGKFLSVFE